MKKGFKLIVPSFLAIIVCVLLVTASTYALFTSDATVNLSVGSATVKVSAEVTNMKTYSITHENTGNFDEAGTIQDGDFAATYYYALQEEGKFAVGGTASFANGTLTLDKMVPGDKVTFTLDSANQSNVDVKYRLSIEATENSSEALLSVLQFKIGNETIRGLKNYYTEWFNSADTALTDTGFEILFPLNSGNTFQTKTVGYSITLQAVQANAKTSGEKNYETIDLFVDEVKSTAQAVVAEQTTNVQIDVPSVEIDDTNLRVSASIPADNTYKDADDQPMIVSSTSLKVSDLFVQTNSLTNETSIAADVKLLDQDGNEIKSVHEDKPVTVTVYVGKGFNSVKVKHNGVVVKGSHYDPDEGTVTFDTASFSPFEFIGDFGALIGTTYYSTFKKAYNAAQNGDTIVLLKDFTMTLENSSDRYAIIKSITIDGGNHTITTNGRGFGVGMGATGKIDVTFKNITIINSQSEGRCIDTRGNLASLTLDTVTLKTTSSVGYVQPLTIGGNQSDIVPITIKNSVIQTSDDGRYGYAITTFNPVNMTITDSDIRGWACLNIKGPSSSAGSSGSSFTISGGSMTSKNVYPGDTNSFCVIKMEDANVNVSYSFTGCKINIIGESNYQGIVSFQDTNFNPVSGCSVTIGAGNIVNFSGNTYFAHDTQNGSALIITGGTFNQDPSGFVAEGYEAVQNADGTWTVAHSE